MVQRHDYRYPFRIGASGQAAQAEYAAHVGQMVRQVLLTSPGERIDLPDFGCGLRRLVFAPHDRNLDSTTQLVVTRALGRWLAREIEVKAVKVLTPQETADEAQLVITVEYLVRETLTMSQTQVRIV
jgi:phage baseplate assembly protein W